MGEKISLKEYADLMGVQKQAVMYRVRNKRFLPNVIKHTVTKRGENYFIYHETLPLSDCRNFFRKNYKNILVASK